MNDLMPELRYHFVFFVDLLVSNILLEHILGSCLVYSILKGLMIILLILSCRLCGFIVDFCHCLGLSILQLKFIAILAVPAPVIS